MAAQLEAPLFRASAKEGLNLRNLFIYFATSLQGRFLKSLSSLPVGSDAFFVANGDDPVQQGAEALGESAAAGDVYCSVA
jgi:hypothetical protein